MCSERSSDNVRESISSRNEKFLSHFVRRQVLSLSLFYFYVINSQRSTSHTHSLHGADVFVSACTFLTKLLPTWKESRLLEPKIVFIVGISALLHDYRHPGVNAKFLASIKHPLSEMYVCVEVREYLVPLSLHLISTPPPPHHTHTHTHTYTYRYENAVLENMHAAETLELLKRHSILEDMTKLSLREKMQCRFLVSKLILSTDFSRGLETVHEIQSLTQTRKRSLRAMSTYNAASSMSTNTSDSIFDDRDKSDEFELILGLIVECSDLGHPARPLRLHQRWSVMVSQEFYAQGRMETVHGVPISPMCEPESELSRKNFSWAKGQQCFIDFLVQPKFEALSQVCNVNDDTWTANLLENHAFWGSRDKLCIWEELSIEVGKDYTFAMAMDRCRGGRTTSKKNIDRGDSTVSTSSEQTSDHDWDYDGNSEGSASSSMTS